MIVRDEADWVEPALESARELGISSWLIADTGSVDETPGLVRELLGDLPGELVELEWQGHAETRSELLRRARGRGDYLLLLDADMTLKGELVDPLVADVYYATIEMATISYGLPILIRSSRSWSYRGVAHSYLAADDGDWSTGDSGLTVIDRRPGAYREGKLEEDAAALEAALERDPLDARSSFYLAQTYQNLGRIPEAIREYGRQALLKGYAEERYVAKLRRARLLSRTDERAGLMAFLDAWQDRPSRAEALYGAARLARLAGGHDLALMFAKRAAELPPTTDRLFLERGIYAWGVKFELGSAEFHTGNVGRGRQILGEVLADSLAPAEYLDWIEELLEEGKIDAEPVCGSRRSRDDAVAAVAVV